MRLEEFLDALISAPDTPARQALLQAHAEHVAVAGVYALKERADLLEQDDARQALAIGQVAQELADQLADPEASAAALWIQANAYDFLGESETAMHCYQRAAELFQAAGKPLEAARTRIGLMFTLMQTGQFEAIPAMAAEARAVFVAHGDVLSQAKLDMNLGNLHYQQGQYSLALADYQQATTAFQSLGETLYGAMNQINQASALTNLDNFREAEQLHAQAWPVFAQADLRTAAAAVEHDLATLQYARGNYAAALRTFEQARDTFAALDNPPNVAQTDLAKSDLYLDLNLPDEALRLVERAELTFQDLGMTFELARARVNHATALARLGHARRATQLLEEARSLFALQANQAWMAHTDLQRAEIRLQAGQCGLARGLASAAAQAYCELGMKTKQAYAHIVTANAWLGEQEWEMTLQELQLAREVLVGLEAPWLEQRIEVCTGRVYEGLGQVDLAVDHYEEATRQIEQMAASLTAEEHRIAFVADKLAPYEALVALTIETDPAAALQWAERAKSRALIDLLATGIRPQLPVSDGRDAELVGRLDGLREELNWLYTRLTRGAGPGESGAPAAAQDTHAKIQEREREATSLWRDLQARYAEQASLLRVAPLELAAVQAGLPPATALVEYFVARGEVLAFVVTATDIRAVPRLASLTDILRLAESLAFQFSKFQYGPGYVQRHSAVMLQMTQQTLARLGSLLVGPLAGDLAGADTLVIVPHGPLHALPFQALRLHDRYLIETHAVAYAPSAAVLKYCWDKPTALMRANGSDHNHVLDCRPLLVGVPDERMVQVTEEIQAVSQMLASSRILLNDEATYERLRQLAPTCNILHLAAHGLFRPEAPLLSSIRLADRWLAVQDVYDLDLHQASLVTLSACESGLGHDAGGDDLVGLVRGFLYAGAASLLVSLWMVDDRSMARLTTGFYAHWLAGCSKAEALRRAQLALLQSEEHPYYWAPLLLVGNQQ